MADNKNMSTALAPSLIGRILAPADFSALDGLIQTLGDKSANLSDSEKSSAMAIIDGWNQSVTARIQANAEQARMILDFLDGAPAYGESLKNIIEMFREATGDTPEYLAYDKAVQEYAAVSMDEPMEPDITENMTLAQADQARAEAYAADLAHSRKVKSAERRFNRAVKDYILMLTAMPEVKALRGSLRSYKAKASRMAAECSDKAARAKLNVTINDPEVRAALHELMDFAKSV